MSLHKIPQPEFHMRCNTVVRVLNRQQGPTVLVGHSFSGMIVTEAGIHPNVSSLVYVAARA